MDTLSIYMCMYAYLSMYIYIYMCRSIHLSIYMFYLRNPMIFTRPVIWASEAANSCSDSKNPKPEALEPKHRHACGYH